MNVKGKKIRCRFFFFFSSRRRHTRCSRDWSSDVCSSDLGTFVSSSLPDQRLSLDRGNHIAQAFRPGRRLVSRRSALLPSYKPAPWTNKWGAFIVGQLAFEHFPFQVWSGLVNRHVRNIRVTSLHYEIGRAHV